MKFKSNGVFSSHRMRFTATLAVLVFIASMVVPGFAQQDNREELVNRMMGYAKLEMEQGSFDKALLYAQQALTLAPENLDAIALHAEITAIWQPRYNKTKHDKSIAKLNGNLPALVTIGQYLEDKQPDKAIEAINKLLKAKTNIDRKGIYHWLLAQAYGRKGEKNKYVRYLKEAVGWEKGNFNQAYLDLVVFYLTQNRNREASQILSIMRQKGKWDARATLLGSYLALMSDSPDDVIKNLQAMVVGWAKNPNAPKDIISSAYNIIGRAYYLRDNRDDEVKPATTDKQLALAAYTNAYNIDPLHTQSLLMLAEIENKAGNFKKALEYCDKIVARDKDNTNAQHVYGMVYMLQPKPDLAKANKAFKTMIDDEGKETNGSLLGQGHAAFLSGDSKLAYAKYTEAIKRVTDEGKDAPSNLEIFSAYTSLASGNKEQAIKHFNNVFANEENSMFTAAEYIQAMSITAAQDYRLFMRATILHQEGWNDIAEKAWKTLLAKHPKCLPAYQALMRIYMAQEEDIEKAQAQANIIQEKIAPAFDKKIPISRLTQAQMISARLKFAEEMPNKRKFREQLINIYTKIKTDFPDRPESWRALINLYQGRGNDDTAKKLCEEGLKKFPIDKVIFRYYITVLDRLKDQETANKAYETFIEKTEETDTSTIGLLFILGRSYLNQNKNDLAIAKLKTLRAAIQQESKGDKEKLEQMRKTNINAYSLLRYLASRQSDTALELKMNSIMKEIDKDSSGLDYTQGFGAFLLGNMEQAVKHFDAEIANDRLDTFHLQAIAGKGMIAFKTGKINDAIAAFDLADDIADCLQEMAMATADRQAYTTAIGLQDWIRFYKACAYLANGKIGAARSNLLRCKTIFPAKPREANSQSAKTRAFELTDLRKALGELSSENNDKYFHLAAGMFYARRGYFPMAGKEFDLEIKANPKNFIAIYLKGMSLLQMRSAEPRKQAIKVFEECLKIEPKFIAAQLQTMTAMMEEHKESKTPASKQAVIDCFDILIKLDPRYNEELASFYVQEEDYDNAITQLIVCANLDSDYIGNKKMEFLNQSAWLAAENLTDKKALAKAVDNAKEAVSLIEARIPTAPNNNALKQLESTKGSILDTLGRVQYKLATVSTGTAKADNIKQAKKNINEAIKLIEQDEAKQNLPTLFSHLGDLLVLEGKKKEALEQYKKADESTRFPEKKHVEEQIEMLSKELK